MPSHTGGIWMGGRISLWTGAEELHSERNTESISCCWILTSQTVSKIKNNGSVNLNFKRCSGHTVCILQKWMLWWIEGKYLQLHTELRKQNGEVPPPVHISIFSMASFCKIELNPPPKKRPGYKKRAVVPTYVSGLGHAVSLMLSIPPSVMKEQGWCNSTALYKNPLLWRSEVCSSGLALPGKLLVECIFKRCWPFLLLWRTEFQNTTAGAERQFYKHSKNLKAICSSLPFSTYHIWETESEEAKNPRRL